MTKHLVVFRNLGTYYIHRTLKTQTGLLAKHKQNNYHLPSTHIEHVASIDVIGSSNVRCQGAGIVCTIGPASRDIKTLFKLIDNGMTIARLNFSHGTHDYHLESLQNIRKAVTLFSEMRQRTVPIGIALDTKGPEIRTGIVEAGVEKHVELKIGDVITVTPDEAFSRKVNSSVVYVDYKNIVNIVTPGSHIFIDDGLINLKVKSIEGLNIKCFIEEGGLLGSRKGVNLPGMAVDLPAVSEKDKSDIQFALKHGFDMIFASFIRSKAGVEELKKLTDTGNPIENMAIIAKIENLQGLENLDEIIEVADGLMVARGDMGIELPSEKVFLAQKTIMAKCNLAGKPVICATQMLESMVNSPRPTRAETSDVANAVLDGTDCVMLSGETAKGKYPIECVKFMKKLCIEAEEVVPYRQLFIDLQKYVHTPTPIAVSTAIAGVNAAEKSSASAILVITTTGATAFVVSRFRPRCPIIAITRHASVARKCLLHRGVIPALHEQEKLDDWPKDIESRIKTGLFVGFQRGIIFENETVIFLTGWKKGQGSTNTIRIMKVTKDLLAF